MRGAPCVSSSTTRTTDTIARREMYGFMIGEDLACMHRTQYLERQDGFY